MPTAAHGARATPRLAPMQTHPFVPDVTAFAVAQLRTPRGSPIHYRDGDSTPHEGGREQELGGLCQPDHARMTQRPPELAAQERVAFGQHPPEARRAQMEAKLQPFDAGEKLPGSEMPGGKHLMAVVPLPLVALDDGAVRRVPREGRPAMGR